MKAMIAPEDHVLLDRKLLESLMEQTLDMTMLSAAEEGHVTTVKVDVNVIQDTMEIIVGK